MTGVDWAEAHIGLHVEVPVVGDLVRVSVDRVVIV